MDKAKKEIYNIMFTVEQVGETDAYAYVSGTNVDINLCACLGMY